MKKILILTASYGTGHLTAAKSLEVALKENYSNMFNVEVIDFVKMPFLTKRDFLAKVVYEKMMETPILWDVFFKITNFKFMANIYAQSIVHSHPLCWKVILEKKPDIVLTTHPFWNYFIPQIKKHISLIDICVVTDSIAIHQSWLVNKEMDYYLVNDEETKNVLRNNGIDSKKVRVFGFPTHPNFFLPFNKYEFLRSLGLSTNSFTILFVFGLIQNKIFLELIDLLQLLRPLNTQLIIITGKYEKLYYKLRQKRYKIPTKVIGWTDEIYKYMLSSDLAIIKSGGAITMECISAGLPCFIPVFTPAQERGNAIIIRKHGLGIVCSVSRKVTSEFKNLITNKNKLQNIKNRINLYRKFNPAKTIAEFIHQIC